MMNSIRLVGRLGVSALAALLIIAISARADVRTVDEAYRVLGLKKNATDAEIKRAHRALLQNSHPDHAGPAGHARSAEINAARDLLKTERAKVVQPATKSANPPPRPADSAHFWAQSPPRRPAQGSNYDFSASVPGQSGVIGFAVNARLRDFATADMIHRNHDYATFLLELDRFLTKHVNPAYHRPFWAFGAHPFALRTKTLTSLPWTMHAMLWLGGVAAVVDAGLGHDVGLVVPAAVAGLELLTTRFTREGRANAVKMAEALNASIQALRTNTGGRGPDAEALKVALLSYDMVAMLAWHNVDRHLGEAMYVRRVLKIAKLFPLARAGLLVRAHANVGSAGFWRSYLRREIARHPVAWAEVADWIENVDVAREIDTEELRDVMGVPARPSLARVRAPIALATDWYHVACEFALAQSPADWRFRRDL